MKTIILAGGEARRFDHPDDLPKQLLTVDGEILIERLCRQFNPDLIVTRDFRVVPVGQVALNNGAPQLTCTADALLHAYRKTLSFDYYGEADWFLFLMSDVYFTDDAEKAVRAASGQGTTFFTDGQDIFAVAVDPSDPRFLGALECVAKHPEVNHGRLWEVYRLMHRIEEFPLKPGAPGLRFLDDATQDFDTWEDYENFLKGESKNVLFRQKQLNLT